MDIKEIFVLSFQALKDRKSGYEGMYSVAKHVYMDDGKIDTIGFAIDKENLRILRAKIDTVLIDDNKKQPNNRKSNTDKINIISF
jgi:hypothetical protein